MNHQFGFFPKVFWHFHCKYPTPFSLPANDFGLWLAELRFSDYLFLALRWQNAGFASPILNRTPMLFLRSALCFLCLVVLAVFLSFALRFFCFTTLAFFFGSSPEDNVSNDASRDSSRQHKQ
jgi:hypothetical protein